MASISIKGLTKSFNAGDDAPAAVSQLDLDIKDNQFVTLLGPSGCGKTTTLRMIAGYIVPDAGTIHVNGRLISAPGNVVPPDQRGMGMVFQNYAVWPHKTVYQNVVFGLKLRKIPAAQLKAKMEETLALVNLTGLEQRYPNELSGGQQQRVALARSLVVEPEILLLDEPLSNLDAKLRENMRVELKRLQRRTGITFVYVTHDQAEALALSDHIAVIHGGRLQQYGTPQDVYARPANRVVADFMGLVNLVPAKVAGPGTLEAAGGLKLQVALPDGIKTGDSVEVSIRPENIQLSVGGTGARATISERTFLGNITEYYASLDPGPTLRVQTHPAQVFAVGDKVTVEIDATQCSVFRSSAL
ncbi:MAG: ABC transporter ATP-binding protein [Xanthobacteraceae bacterium]|nr:ABC transporter ATP-binding protein [Xanthobacteraceae bacterium]